MRRVIKCNNVIFFYIMDEIQIVLFKSLQEVTQLLVSVSVCLMIGYKIMLGFLCQSEMTCLHAVSTNGAGSLFPKVKEMSPHSTSAQSHFLQVEKTFYLSQKYFGEQK